jgi:hypothetical protein
VHTETTAPPSSGFFDKDTLGAEAEKEFPHSPMGIDPKERFTKGDEVGNVQDRVRRELMKLHAVNKNKPAEEFMPRKR